MGDIEHYTLHYLQITHKLSRTQSTVLGCILFLLYKIDVSKLLHTNSILYAEDITFVFQRDDSNELKQQLNAKLIKVKPSQNQLMKFESSYENCKVASVNSCNLLWVKIDTGLSWKEHVDKVSGKLARSTYDLLKLNKWTNLKLALTAYYPDLNIHIRNL